MALAGSSCWASVKIEVAKSTAQIRNKAQTSPFKAAFERGLGCRDGEDACVDFSVSGAMGGM